MDRQEYISWKLPKDWHIVLTANPDNGEYLVNTIDIAQRTRFVSTTLKWNHERWAEWAEVQGIDGRCINFVLMNPEIVNDRVNPRSLTTFFNCISSFESFDNNLPMIQMLGEGSVGPEVASLFTTFIKNKLDQLVTPKEILFEQSDTIILDKLRNCLNDGVTYRADIASILTTRLVNFAINYANNNKITPKVIQRLQFLIKEPDSFTEDLKYIIVKKLLNGNKRKFQMLITDPIVQDYATK